MAQSNDSVLGGIAGALGLIAICAMVVGGCDPQVVYVPQRDASVPHPPPPADDLGMGAAQACGCYAGDGDYCGGAALAYAVKNGCTLPDALDPNSLYHCAGGQWTVKQACPAGCTYNPNGADACTELPCACYSGDTDYCGKDATAYAAAHQCTLPSTFTDGYLYQCAGGTWTLAQPCSLGCVSGTAGMPAACALPTCTCFLGTGPYCGGTMNAYAQAHQCQVPSASDTSGLYTCQKDSAGNPKWTLMTECGTGMCYQNANGTDSCINPCSKVPSADNGFFCGSSTQFNFDANLANPQDLYDCENGQVASDTPCTNGCAIATSGPDGCNPAPDGGTM